MGGQLRGVSTTSLSNTTAGEICARLGFSGDGELNVIIYVFHNYECFIIITEPTVMSFELTRGDVYCCNNELHCTQCNQTMSIGLLDCRTYQETTTVLSRQVFTTTMSPATNNPQTVDGECQYSANPTVTFHVLFLLLRQLLQ